MINNRQAGRRRGRGGQQQRPQGNSGARDNGNRIDNRSRGNAAQLLEKYKALARDAQMSGDRVNTEYYLQFADHYFRVLAETRSRFEESNRPPIQGANSFQDDEQDYEDEGDTARAEQPRQQDGNRQDGNRQDGARQDGNRQDGGRQDRPDRQDRQDGNRQERASGQYNNGQSFQGERQSEGQRGVQNDRPERQYDERPRRQNGRDGGNGNGASEGNASNDQAADRYVREDRNRNRERPERYQTEERAPVEAQAALAKEAPQVDVQQDDAPRVEPQEAPRRRGRPRREPAAEAPAAFEADRLPPSLNISAVAPVADAPANDVGGDEPEEKPRRRRGRPPAAEVTSA